MNVSIYSREAVEELIKKDFPKNVAVISFYDPEISHFDKGYKPVDYSSQTDRVFLVKIRDIDLEILGKYNLTYDTYFSEVDELAKFIYSAKDDGLDIICQCEYGQSRSAACASAILEHFDRNGISIFRDYRYYPNQLVFNKMYEALENYKERM